MKTNQANDSYVQSKLLCKTTQKMQLIHMSEFETLWKEHVKEIGLTYKETN